MKYTFYKYEGTGNDFIILDNRTSHYEGLSELEIKSLCDRRFGIGADGLMMLCLEQGYDFRMKYYNADGKEGSMCGNGGRCLVQFAFDMGIKKDTYHFIAVDGPHDAVIKTNGLIGLKMQDVNSIQMNNEDVILNTGSPHFIRFVDNLDSFDVFTEGRSIRNNNSYKIDGINVNFVEKQKGSIKLRTYERGVEDETLSCGTGATAAAIAYATQLGMNKVPIQVQGGLLEVEFNRISENECNEIWLTGPAKYVFSGTIDSTLLT
jgi:diaminopimelate epimerase